MRRFVLSVLVLSAFLGFGGLTATLAAPKPPAVPAKVTVSVAPEAVAPGGESTVTLVLKPIDGVKLNRYPKIKLQVPATEGLVGDTEVAIGNNKAPELGADPKANYFDPVDPLEVTLKVDAGASSGDHQIEAKLTYFYCMPASGFCAPKRTTVQIPLSVQ
jgi:hypothetical protein